VILSSAARLALRMSTSTVIHHCPSQIALSMDTCKQVTTVDPDELVWGEEGGGRPKAIYFLQHKTVMAKNRGLTTG